MAGTAEVPPFPVARLSVDDYHRMIETGVLGTEDRLELLDGWLVPKVTHNPPHAYRVQQVSRVLQRQFDGPTWTVRAQLPITLDRSEPEPDIAIVADRDFGQRHPSADEVLVVFEVADSSLRDDRVRKTRIYAAGGIARYVIVNVGDRQVEVFSDPDPEAQSYRSHVIVTGGVIDAGGELVEVADLLGPRN